MTEHIQTNTHTTPTDSPPATERASRKAAAEVPPRARLTWTLGNLLMLVGAFLLLYVGGLYAQVEYNRYAARGDTDLAAPRVFTSVTVESNQTSSDTPAAFTVPLLDGANSTDGQIVSDVPADADAPGSTVERIIIPSIDIDSKVIEVGWDVVQQDGQEVAVWQVAEYAVGHHKGSANPGEGDNVVLAGHVGGYGKVFLDLFYVEPGDQVVVYSEGQQYLYVVQERLVLDEEGVPLEQRQENARYIQSTGEEMITLVTCWPPSGPDIFSQRVIVRAVPYGATGPQTQQAQDSVFPRGEAWTVR